MVEVMGATAYEHFMAAFDQLVSQGGKGTQRRIATSSGKSPVQINDVLKRRKRAPQDLQEEIAKYFGMAYEEMLALGRKICDGKIRELLPFQAELERLPERSKDRYLFIYRKVCELLDVAWLYDGALYAIEAAPDEFKAYRQQEIDDLGVFRRGQERIARIRDYLVREFQDTSGQ
jgi:hypothetical protein